VVTTQACEKIYRSAGGLAEVSSRLRLGPAARLAWLPQEAIVFDGARLARRLDVELAEGAEVLVLEAVVFGRAAMSEQVVTAEISDRWEVRRDGRLIHAEAFSIGSAVEATLERSAVAAGAGAVACLLLVADQAPQRLAAVRTLIGEGGGASAWTVGRTGKLLARVIASDSYGLRQRLVPLLELLSGEAALPKVWSI
jgi:urease accessory protein